MKQQRIRQYRWRWIAFAFLVVVLVSSVYLVVERARASNTCFEPETQSYSSWSKGSYVTIDRNHPDCKEAFTLQSSIPYLNKELCCNLGRDRTLPDLCGAVNTSTLGSEETKNPVCTCVDFMACRMVTVTAVSSKYYAQLLDGLASIQNFHPGMKILVYNLGLSQCEISHLTSLYNVEVRLFPFEQYPPHVRRLQNYAWKMLLVSTVLEKYEVVFYMDSSTRLRRSLTVSLLTDLKNFPFRGEMTAYRDGAFTSDSMYKWFGLTREEFGGNFQIGSNMQLVRRTPTTTKLLREAADCALRRDCIDPPGVSPAFCKEKLHAYNSPTTLPKTVPNAGCFRYDQSALTILIYKYFEVNSQSFFVKPLGHTLAVMGSYIHCFSLYKSP